MIEKNVKKIEARKHRVWFDTKLGTITHASKKRPGRQAVKKETRVLSGGR